MTKLTLLGREGKKKKKETSKGKNYQTDEA